MKQRREDGKGRGGSYKDEDESASLLSEGGLNKRMSEGVSAKENDLKNNTSLGCFQNLLKEMSADSFPLVMYHFYCIWNESCYQLSLGKEKVEH